MQKMELRRKKLAEECVIAQRKTAMHERGRAVV